MAQVHYVIMADYDDEVVYAYLSANKGKINKLAKDFKPTEDEDGETVNYIMEHGYKEYRDQLLEGYKIEVSHREEIPYPYMTRLFNIDFISKASVAYDTMCNRLDIRPNWNLFEDWHTHNFKGCNTTEDAVVNTIVRVSTGYDFTFANWNYFQQAVFDLAIEETDNENDSKTFERWLSNRR